MNEKELRQNFVDKAISYLGADEGGLIHKHIIDTYNKIKPLPGGYKVKYTDAWCATYVSAIASMCGLLDIIPAECSCNRQIELWKKMGRWQEKDNYVPAVGDIIYYAWKDSGVGDCTLGSDHVGIVASVSNGRIKVIEGNYSDSVGYRTLAVNGRFVRGYGLPNFASKATSGTISSSKESVCDVELKVLKQGSQGSAVKALQILLEGNNCKCGKSGPDGIFGGDTLLAVKKFQREKNLDTDGIVGKNTWAKLLL